MMTWYRMSLSLLPIEHYRKQPIESTGDRPSSSEPTHALEEHYAQKILSTIIAKHSQMNPPFRASRILDNRVCTYSTLGMHMFSVWRHTPAVRAVLAVTRATEVHAHICSGPARVAARSPRRWTHGAGSTIASLRTWWWW